MNYGDLIEKIRQYVSEHIADFHNERIKKLDELELVNLLKKKNPYLYKAKDLNTPGAIVDSIASAFISSAEETMFGTWLEKLAIFIAGQVYGAAKSTSEGIDLEMDKDGIHYVVSIKSGPNWSNSSSMKEQIANFMKASRVYRTSGNKLPFAAIEGCCYGKVHSEKNSHTKICGQEFWEFISGSSTLYTDIIEPLGTDATAKNEEYKKKYDQKITLFTCEFSKEYCDGQGNINWNKIVEMNSRKRIQKHR